MESSVERFLAYLNECGVAAAPGLDDPAIAELERALDAPLPGPVRALYRACGGVGAEAMDHLPMRLLSPAEAFDEARNLGEQLETYQPHPDARYLFLDEGSNWAGVFVRGPLTGKLVLLDRQEPSRAPRFRDLAAFLDAVVVAGRDHADFTTLSTSYPLGPDSPADLVDEARPLAHHYLAQYRGTTELAEVLDAAEMVLALLPPDEWAVMKELLESEHQFIRWTVLRVAAVHKTRELVPEIASYARESQNKNNYTHWSTAYAALRAIGADAELDALARAKPGNWRIR